MTARSTGAPRSPARAACGPGGALSHPMRTRAGSCFPPSLTMQLRCPSTRVPHLYRPLRRYNAKSEETTWHVPAEVEARAALRLDPVKAKMLERAKAMGAQVAPEYAAGAGSRWGWAWVCGWGMGWGWASGPPGCWEGRRQGGAAGVPGAWQRCSSVDALMLSCLTRNPLQPRACLEARRGRQTRMILM